ncbi:MAG: serine/threonine-protein kinase [Kofleriaceae bacterium]
MFKPGSQVGRYRVIKTLGRGKPDGLFEVEDEDKNKFALRAPIGDLEDDDRGSASVCARFRGDADSLKSIVHLNLVPLFDVFVDKGCLCFIYERVRGRTLADAISLGQLAPPLALGITRSILEGCAVAHAAGRIHRDLRPGKVLLIELPNFELVKVADMGLGSIRDEALLEFGAGALTGTVRKPVATYMAPEQVRERSVDARTDIYAIGTMLFEMLAARAPFPDRDMEQVKTMQLSFPPPRLFDIFRTERWLTPEINELVDVSLAKERTDRYSSAADMLAAVDAAYKSIT